MAEWVNTWEGFPETPSEWWGSSSAQPNGGEPLWVEGENYDDRAGYAAWVGTSPDGPPAPPNVVSSPTKIRIWGHLVGQYNSPGVAVFVLGPSMGGLVQPVYYNNPEEQPADTRYWGDINESSIGVLGYYYGGDATDETPLDLVGEEIDCVYTEADPFIYAIALVSHWVGWIGVNSSYTTRVDFLLDVSADPVWTNYAGSAEVQF